MKIPPQAKKVFTGVIFDVYQWEQTLYDGSTATFEMLKRPDTVQVIAVADDKIVISKESQPMKENFMTILGGRIEAGEEPIAAAQRELLEESGLVSTDWELWKTHEPSGKIDWTVYTYIARGCTKVQEPELDPGEKITLQTLVWEDFLTIATDKNFSAKDLAFDLLQMKANPSTLEIFREKLFRK